jgi:hypothetical protein
MIIRRSVIDKIGPIPESIFRLRADFFLQTLASNVTKIGVIKEPLTAYRIHGANGYSGRLSNAKLEADWHRTSEFVEWIKSNLGIQIDPVTNYTYARSAIWVHRTRGELMTSFHIALSYFYSSIGNGALKRSIFRTLFLASMAVQPQITSWLFNKLLTGLWRA